jgi:TolB-like protein
MGAESAEPAEPARAPTGAVFLSYASQDAAAAQRICAALRAAGVEVWFDQSELRGGDAWDQKIRREIHDCALFIPIVSQHTQVRLEGYFRHEWKLAIERIHHMAEQKSFLVPVVIDNTRDQEAIVPDAFKAVQWTRLSGGETPPVFVDRVQRLLSGEASTVKGTLVGTSEHASTRSRRVLPTVIAVVFLGAAAYLTIDKFWITKSPSPTPAAVPAPKAQTVATRAAAIPSTPTTASENSIAVLPFVDMSERKDQEYFADGMADELIYLLAKSPGLYVPARTSSFYFKGKQTTVEEIARALNVSHVLEGSVRKSGGVVRVTVQLIQVDSGRHLWSETYNRKLDDIFGVQDEITAAVATALNVALSQRTPSRAAPIKNAEAYTLYLRGQSARDDAESVDFLHQALTLDPTFAPAWAGLCQRRLRQHSNDSSSRDERAAEARYAAGRALALDSVLVEAHLAAGAVRRDLDWDWKGAEAEFRQALNLDPRSADALGAAASIPWFLGRYDEALQFYQRAIAQDPLAAAAYHNKGRVLFYAGHMAEAETNLRQALALNTGAGNLHWYIALTLLFRGDRGAALSELRSEPNGGLQTIGQAIVYHALGRNSESDAAMVEAEAQLAECCSFFVAAGYAYRGEVDRAFEWLDRAYRRHDDQLERIKGHPLLKNLQADTRYAVLLRKMRLVE